MTPVQGDQSDQSGADQMSVVLASLDKADGQSLVTSLATALCEHAAALKDKLAARVSCEEKQNQADILTALEQEKKDCESKQDQTKRDHAKQMEEMNNFLSSKIEQNLQPPPSPDETRRWPSPARWLPPPDHPRGA